jgi:hypothetical protein
MRVVRQEKKLSAQRSNSLKKPSKPTRLASKIPPSEAETHAAKATLANLDIKAWAHQNIAADRDSYIVVDSGVCPLECVLKRAETLRTGQHKDIIADPGMIDFVNLLLDSREEMERAMDDVQSDVQDIELGPLVGRYLKQRQSLTSSIGIVN